jgi:hypothetical protein
MELLEIFHVIRFIKINLVVGHKSKVTFVRLD